MDSAEMIWFAQCLVPPIFFADCADLEVGGGAGAEPAPVPARS
jgi:hypothetical protein